MPFFQGFTLDTLLGGISCILGIVALIIGGKAYKKCKIIKAAANDKKEFNDSSSDYSQRAAGDIINNNCDVNALATITSANFSESLQMAINHFEELSKNNLQQIIGETHRIIQENNIDFSGFKKTDWINFYFESAKNTSDQYMQGVWARVLALELAKPNSISFLTIDVLKKLNQTEFQMLERLASIHTNGMIVRYRGLEKWGFDWMTLQRLKDFGLISLDSTENTITVKARDLLQRRLGNSHIFYIKNPSDKNGAINVQCYLLTTPTMELLELMDGNVDDETAKEIVSEYTKNRTNNSIQVFLFRIKSIDSDGTIHYNTNNLLG